MVRVCAMPNCGNRMRRYKGLSFHRLPLYDPDTLPLWLAALQIDEQTPFEVLRGKDYRVCSEHFSEDDFKLATERCTRLKKSAVPRPLEVPAEESEAGISETIEDEFATVSQSTLDASHQCGWPSSLIMVLTSPEQTDRSPPTTPSFYGTYMAQLPVREQAVGFDAIPSPDSAEDVPQTTTVTSFGNHVGRQTDPPSLSSRSTQLSMGTLGPHVRSKGTQVSGCAFAEIGTTTTDAPWKISQGPLACPPSHHPRPAKRPRLNIVEEDIEIVVTEVPEAQESTAETAELGTVTTESPQPLSTEVLVNTRCLLELFQSCWFCQRECDAAIKGNGKLFSVTQDCRSCGYHRDWSSQPSSGFSIDDEESLSEEEEKKKKKKKKKRKSDSSDEWEPWLDEETTDSDADPSPDEDLFKALKEDGQGKLLVWCTQCETEASRSCSVLQHKKLFCCARCSATDDTQTHTFETLPVRFENIFSFQIHAEQEHGSKPFYILCQECGKFVSTKKEHICEHKVKFIICPECGRRFLTEGGLKTHYTQLHSDYDHPCKYCLKVFKTRSTKLEHEQTHPKEKQPYSCPDCPERFNNIHKRNNHVKSHRGPYKYVCDVCEKGFRDFNRMRRHKLIHTGELPYKCQICDRSFNQSQNLTSHMRVHTGEKPFMCEQCGESFSHNVSLKNHKQRHHESGLTREEEIMEDVDDV